MRILNSCNMKAKISSMALHAVAAALVSLLFTGCDSLEDQADFNLNHLILRDTFSPLRTNRSGADAQTTSVTEEVIEAKAVKNVSSVGLGLTNTSYEDFTAGLTVAYSGTTGYVSGSSGAMLLMNNSVYNDNEETYEMAVFDGPANGFDCYVTGVLPGARGTALSGTTQFEDTHSLDLRVAQISGTLTYSARPTPTGAGTGNWTVIYSSTTGPGFLSYDIAYGMVNMKKGSGFYFNRFYMDGEGVGGLPEGQIFQDVRQEVDASGTAAADLEESTPDYTDAGVAMTAAISANTQAEADLQSAITDESLQTPGYEKQASKTLKADGNSLLAVQKQVAKAKKADAKAALASLKVITGSEQSVLAELIGLKVPPKDTTIPNMVFLHAPQ